MSSKGKRKWWNDWRKKKKIKGSQNRNKRVLGWREKAGRRKEHELSSRDVINKHV